MKIQHYHRATSLDDAYNVLNASDKNFILGGALWLKQISKEMHTAIDLQDLQLNEIQQDDTCFIIGSMATLYRLEVAEALNEWCDQLIKEAVQHIMGVAFRNSATIGGSVMGRYAFSDLLGALLVLDAELIFHQSKPLPIETFLKERHAPKDILVAIKIPKNRGKSYFKKVSNTRLDFSILNLTMFKSDKGFKLAIGSRPSVAALAKETMNYIEKNPLNDQTIKEAQTILLDELTFGNNQRGSSDYRKQLAKVYLKRGLKEVMDDDR